MLIFTDSMVIRESCNVLVIDSFHSALGWKIQRMGNNLPSNLINIVLLRIGENDWRNHRINNFLEFPLSNSNLGYEITVYSGRGG